MAIPILGSLFSSLGLPGRMSVTIDGKRVPLTREGVQNAQAQRDHAARGTSRDGSSRASGRGDNSGG